MTIGEPFATGVLANSGIWAEEPEWMSYSSLREIEECPRRWALRRSSYPEVWTRRGYPDVPSMPTLVGDVVHACLERLFRALVERGCGSPRSACAVQVLRGFGGYTSIVESAIEARLASLEPNPRVRDRLSSLRNALIVKLPELRRRVQEIVSRSTLSPRLAEGNVSAGRPLGGLLVGSYTEVDLRAEGLRWMGRVDLISITDTACEIVDYKTGKENEGHADQLQTYALLWLRDTTHNPTARAATKLTAAYSTHDAIVDVPSEARMAELEAALRSRTAMARIEILQRPPRARPNADICSGCSVRQLCPEYWQYLELRGNTTYDGSPAVFGDVELQIASRRGPKSWDVSVTRGASPSAKGARLRAHDESEELEPGGRVRILNVLIQRDDESELLLMTMTEQTEVFRLEPVS